MAISFPLCVAKSVESLAEQNWGLLCAILRVLETKSVLRYRERQKKNMR